MAIDKQVRMVFDLNKCLGCQACTMACKTMWTDRQKGLQYMYWNNVETRPGMGYPRNWETLGGGFDACSTDVHHDGALADIQANYGAPWEYNYSRVLGDSLQPGNRILRPSPRPDGPDAYAANWDEDVGQGAMPNNFYFYLPRICNHCTNPACLAACPRQAIYKRPEDGIVLVDQNRCRGYRFCVRACPYKKVYFNATPFDTLDTIQAVPDIDPKVQALVPKRSQKCIFCYPRIEKFNQNPDTGLNPHSFCFTQCVGRVRYVGYYKPGDAAFNSRFNVNRLIDEFQVALQLHPEFGTQPNLYYIPPMSPPTISGTGAPQTGTQRIPVEFLAALFGDSCTAVNEAELGKRIGRIQGIFETLAKAKSGTNPELQRILIARSEADRLQLNLA